MPGKSRYTKIIKVHHDTPETATLRSVRLSCLALEKRKLYWPLARMRLLQSDTEIAFWCWSWPWTALPIHNVLYSQWGLISWCASRMFCWTEPSLENAFDVSPSSSTPRSAALWLRGVWSLRGTSCHWWACSLKHELDQVHAINYQREGICSGKVEIHKMACVCGFLKRTARALSRARAERERSRALDRSSAHPNVRWRVDVKLSWLARSTMVGYSCIDIDRYVTTRPDLHMHYKRWIKTLRPESWRNSGPMSGPIKRLWSQIHTFFPTKIRAILLNTMYYKVLTHDAEGECEKTTPTREGEWMVRMVAEVIHRFFQDPMRCSPHLSANLVVDWRSLQTINWQYCHVLRHNTTPEMSRALEFWLYLQRHELTYSATSEMTVSSCSWQMRDTWPQLHCVHPVLYFLVVCLGFTPQASNHKVIMAYQLWLGIQVLHTLYCDGNSGKLCTICTTSRHCLA